MRKFATAVAICAMAGLISCGPNGDSDSGADELDDFDQVTQAHHRPGHSGGPPGSRDNDNGDNGNNGNNGNNGYVDEDGIVRCSHDGHCSEGEVCSQGGRCIDVTGSRSVLAELQADLDDLPEAVGMGVPYELPPNAKLRIDDENGDGIGLFLDNAVIFEGNGSVLIVENGMVGMRLINGTSGAQWSTVKNLRIQPQERGEHEGIGIDVRAHGLRLENLWIQYMGTGIRAHTYANDLGHANVNTQQWSRIILSNNYHHGMHVRSGDSNAGLFSGIEVLGGAGIQDDSFLGNTYLSPVITSDRGASLDISSNASSSLVLGLYLEDSAKNPTAVSANDLHVGGNAINRLETRGDRIGRQHTKLRFRNEHGVRMRIPGGPYEAFAFRHPDETYEWRMRYFPSPRQWRFFHVGSGQMPYRWTGEHHNQGPGLYQLGTPMQ